MSNIDSQIQLLNPDSIIELFTLDLNPIGENTKVRFCNEAFTNGNRVSFNGIQYDALPIEAEGFELTNKGQPPRPTVKISNVEGTLTVLINQYQDLVGCILKRIRTMVRYLDNGVEPDPSQVLPPDYYYVERKTSENKLFVEFELSSPIETQIKLPQRLITQRCTWEYRGENCGYNGSNYFDEFDNPVSDPNKDKCGKRVSSCRKRFGDNAPLPFGGFPGVQRY